MSSIVDESKDNDIVRLRAAEDVFFDQLVKGQQRLSDEIWESSPANVKSLTSMNKDLLSAYTDASYKRKMAEIAAGKYVPLKVIERYQSEVLPSIATAIDNLRLGILNAIDVTVRPQFDAAWNGQYRKFVVTLSESIRKLDEYLAQAKAEAGGQNPTIAKRNAAIKHGSITTKAHERNTDTQTGNKGKFKKDKE